MALIPRMTSLESLTRSSVSLTIRVRARANARATSDDRGMSATVTARPTNAGIGCSTLINMIMTVMIWNGADQSMWRYCGSL